MRVSGIRVSPVWRLRRMNLARVAVWAGGEPYGLRQIAIFVGRRLDEWRRVVLLRRGMRKEQCWVDVSARSSRARRRPRCVAVWAPSKTGMALVVRVVGEALLAVPYIRHMVRLRRMREDHCAKWVAPEGVRGLRRPRRSERR